MDDDPQSTDTLRHEELFAGGGFMGGIMRGFDWAASELGPVESWPLGLRSALTICLNSRFPIAIYWGPDLNLLYNDAWSPILGTKHPWALGRGAREVWPEIWSTIGPLFARVVETGEGTWSEDELLPMRRHGYTEECYFNFTFSPIRAGARVEGIFNAVIETTFRVIGERRTRVLREVAVRTGGAKSATEACAAAAGALRGSPADVPFSLLYLLDTVEGEPRRARCAGASGLPVDWVAKHETVMLDDAAAIWPLAGVLETGEPMLVEGLEARLGFAPPGRPWPEPTQLALVLPIDAVARAGQVAGFLVAGISPRRAMDDEYRAFLERAADHVATAIANSRAFEEETRRAEALAELDRAKTIFFTNISHEFRTPLTLMLGPLEDLLGGRAGPLTEAQRGEVELAWRNSLRLLRLVNMLLDFSRIQAGRTEASYEPTDLAAVTAELASTFRSAADRAGLRLIIDAKALPEPVFVDRDMWEKIVLNLLSNAFKYTLEGEIEIKLRGTAGGTELSVRDTGTGIPAEELPYIFERFHTVKSTRGRTREGSGIGLALVRELVRMHGGELSVESALGTGTTFRVQLPTGIGHLPVERIAPASDLSARDTARLDFADHVVPWLPPRRTPEEADPGGSALAGTTEGNVLLADDNADLRKYLRRLLEQQGYRVRAVADGNAALESARHDPPDLVVSDVMMPGLDGFELLDALRADGATAGIPVILLSAQAGEEARVEGIEAGADDYLAKPFSARELIARVRTHLQLALLRQSAATRERELREEAERARSAAEHANRAKSAFLATMSHELRTPLNAIIGFADLLDAEIAGPLNEGQKTQVERIEMGARHLLDLIEEILGYARLEAGREAVHTESCDLAGLCRETAALIEPLATGKGLAFHIDLPDRLSLETDPGKVRQILLNLLSNAVKFTSAGELRLELHEEAGGIVLHVSDTGSGIADEHLAAIFEPFSQVEHPPGRQSGGTGLGLSVTRQLARLLGGDVTVGSVVGRGSRFTVRLARPTS
jgi:signal transduction histidine kinase